MIKKIMLTAMAFLSVATIKPFAQPGFSPDMALVFMPSTIKKAAGFAKNNQVATYLTGLTAYGLTVAASLKAYASYMTPKKELTRFEKFKNSLVNAKNYVVDSRIVQEAKSNPKTALAIATGTAATAAGAYVYNNSGSVLKDETSVVKTAPVETVPVEVAPVEKAPIKTVKRPIRRRV